MQQTAPIPAPGSTLRSSRLLWSVAAAGVLLVLAFVVSQNYEVVSKTPIAGTEDTLYKIRFFDAFTVSLRPEVKPSSDVVNVYLLTVASTVALVVALLLRVARVEPAPRVLAFFVCVFAGAAFLAADELMGIHESIGVNLTFLENLPGIDRADDAVVVAYGLGALAFVYAFRRVFLDAPAALKLFAAGAVIFVGASGFDVLGVAALEELVEVAASFVGILGFLALALHYLRVAGIVPERGEAAAR